MRTATGLSTEAIFIFHNMVKKLIASFAPEYIAAVFESSEPTFRAQSFAEYKANRSEMPPDLGEQIPQIRRLLEAMQIPILEFAGYEADDVIGSISCHEGARGLDVVVVSSDKDLLQLVTPRVSMLNPMKDDEWYDEAKVEVFMGVKPKQVADLLALKGDAIDNIPGAPGIGDKGAKDLIVRFGTVEAALERAAEVERKAYRESLVNHRDQILMSKKLATVETSVPIEWRLEELRAKPAHTTSLKALYREFEFFSLLKDLPPEDDSGTRDYAVFENEGDLKAWLAERKADAPLAIVLDVQNRQMGLSFSAGQGRAAPLDWLDAIRDVVADNAVPKVVHDSKAFLIAAHSLGMQPKNVGEDVFLYAFLVAADPGACSPEALSERILDRKLHPSPEQIAEAVYVLAETLRPQVERDGLRSVYESVDLPLSPVLARMEETGIRVDTGVLAELSARLTGRAGDIAQKIYEAAGHEFNINSPQQLGKVLFQEMSLPAPVKWGKGKVISTAADVLESLAAEYPVAQQILDYRQLTKLKGTYTDALPQLIRGETGRVHTTFNQAGAATGRLSSSNPNLQNIPIKTSEGREIRAAFVPEPGWKLVVADYSQIELRLLAHMSEDSVLMKAFLGDEDVHTRTAAEVFKVDPAFVTHEMRRSAKAVNFGIVYGQTPFGLAQTLGIDRKEAELYIRRYFERYSGVREFIDRTVAEVRVTGVSKTLHGRCRPIPDMQSRNPSARSFAERTAVNTPLQGTAADLIKLAMIRIDEQLREEKRKSRLLLQVHDELVLESPPDEVEQVKAAVKSQMENVHALKVPLVVEVGEGLNWRDAK